MVFDELDPEAIFREKSAIRKLQSVIRDVQKKNVSSDDAENNREICGNCRLCIFILMAFFLIIRIVTSIACLRPL